MNIATSNQSSLKSKDLSESEKVAAVAWQTIREIFPTQNSESDYSIRIRIELMGKIVEEVGSERFTDAVKRAISISQRRYDVTIHRIREMAGLRFVPPPSAVSQAWCLATKIFTDHARTDAEGSYRLEPKYLRHDGKVYVTPPPEIPAPVMRAIEALGGWGSLADRSNWSYRFKDFKDVFCEDEAGPRVDSGVGLEKVG